MPEAFAEPVACERLQPYRPQLMATDAETVLANGFIRAHQPRMGEISLRWLPSLQRPQEPNVLVP